MATETKCPHCGEWTPSSGQLRDRCTHCGELLNKARLAQTLEKAAINKKISEESPFVVRKDDSLAKRFFKRSTLVFIAIVMFLVFLSLMTHA